MKPRPSHLTQAGRTYLTLQKKARTEGRPTDELLRLHVLECYLDRVTTTSFAPKLVLKGGVLLSAYGIRRPTRDIDLSANRMSGDATSMLNHVATVLAERRDDGWVFGQPTHEPIRDAEKYSGSRLTIPCALSKARLTFHVDVSVGEPVQPPPRRINLPRVLGGTIALQGYPLAMIHAEKLVTMLQRSIATTRWRDFADVYLLAEQHDIDGAQLRKAIDAVAEFRQVALTPLPLALDGLSTLAQSRWAAWIRKQGLQERLPETFADVIESVQRFGAPALNHEIKDAYWSKQARAWQPARSRDAR